MIIDVFNILDTFYGNGSIPGSMYSREHHVHDDEWMSFIWGRGSICGLGTQGAMTH